MAAPERMNLLNNVTSAVTGVWARAHTVVKKNFEVTITGTATVVIEGCNDPSFASPATLGTLTATGYVQNEDAYKYVRARVSAYTSGSVKVDCFGQG